MNALDSAKGFPLSNNLLFKMYKLWTYPVKFNDRSSWTESDQAHYFGYRLNSQETKEDSSETEVRQDNSGSQRAAVGTGRVRRVPCPKDMRFQTRVPISTFL